MSTRTKTLVHRKVAAKENLSDEAIEGFIDAFAAFIVEEGLLDEFKIGRPDSEPDSEEKPCTAKSIRK